MADEEANTAADLDEEEKESWAASKSEAILRAGILKGTITPEMKPKQVFDMAPDEHGKWKYGSWASNLRNLRDAIDRDRGRMESDILSYGHDLAILKEYRKEHPLLKPKWRGSAAAEFLKDDIDDYLAKKSADPTVKPINLYKSRPEYQVFELIVFRKQLYQRMHAESKREYRFEKKKKAWKYPELHEDHPRLQE